MWDVGCGMWDVRFEIADCGFGIWNLEFGILRFGIWDCGFGILNLKFGIWNSDLWIEDYHNGKNAQNKEKQGGIGEI